MIFSFFFLVSFHLLISSSQNTWVIELKPNVDPNNFAKSHNIEYVGPTEVNDNLHIFTSSKPLKMTRDTEWMEEQVPQSRFKRSDPLFADQWHLQVVQSTLVQETGKGVRIGIVDDGVQHNHPEIYNNYDSTTSYNFNGGPNDKGNPSPIGPQDGHGTAAAAVAVGVKNNDHCGQGVAPGAKVSGLRLIAKPVTDLQESSALSKFSTKIDIYSNSWGPADTGKGLDAPGRLVRETLAKYAGSSVGRNGKGTIYVWASGNGKQNKDSCAYDGYAGNPYVNAIGAVAYDGRQAYYSEGCANLLAVAPSSGYPQKGITTADLLGKAGYSEGECTNTFGGTSSAAPLAAGIIALMLEKRPDLTWRDVRHVIARAAVRIDPDHLSWTIGKTHSNVYGFGLLVVPNILNELNSYVNVPTHQKQIFTETIQYDSLPINGRTEIQIPFSNASLDFVENVILIVSLAHAYRGKVRISIISPDNFITSVLAEERDDDNANYNNWAFSSLSFWGCKNAENSTWKVVFEDNSFYTGQGKVEQIKFGLFGF